MRQSPFQRGKVEGPSLNTSLRSQLGKCNHLNKKRSTMNRSGRVFSKNLMLSIKRSLKKLMMKL